MPFDVPFTLADARAKGLSRSVVRGWLQRGEAVQLGHGLFSPAHCAAADRIHVSRAVVDGRLSTSYLGAADVHGLLVPPEVHPPWKRPMRPERIPPEHRWRRGVLRVPSAAWTAVSLARFQPLPSALVPLDSALRNGVERNALAAVIADIKGWPGSSLLSAALYHADALAESALESLARGGFIVEKLPAPVLQAEVVVRGSRYRLDFLWPSARLVLEVDGLVKYQDSEALRMEKRRHNDLVAAGYTVLRCGYANVYPSAATLVTQIRRILNTSYSP